MGAAVTDYTRGAITVNNFKEKLAAYNVPVDSNLDKLIRKHEAGDSISYSEFGKHIFR